MENTDFINSFTDFNIFKNYILDSIKLCPKEWRKGQSVFNLVDEVFGVARAVQFEDNVDCFYNDANIDEFIEKAFERLSKTI